MGVVIPSIPYKSQYDLDANEFRNDCGPACLAMLLHAFGIYASTNAVYRKTGASPDRYVTVPQLLRAAESYGVSFEYLYAWTIPRLIQTLEQGKAVMALVHYGGWSQINPGVSTQNTFQGPHFVVVVGADEQHIYINDPLWKDARRSQGYHRAWTHAEFHTAWSNNHLDGNRDCSGIVTQKSLPTAAIGSGPWAPSMQLAADGPTILRLRAWAYFNNAPQPVLSNPATVNAYLTVMGAWGDYSIRHTVREDDDLRQLALHYYGDAAKWRVILAFNGLSPGDAIAEGDVLRIPQPLETPVPISTNSRPSGRTPALFTQLNKDRLAGLSQS